MTRFGSASGRLMSMIPFHKPGSALQNVSEISGGEPVAVPAAVAVASSTSEASGHEQKEVV